MRFRYVVAVAALGAVAACTTSDDPDVTAPVLTDITATETPEVSDPEASPEGDPELADELPDASAPAPSDSKVVADDASTDDDGADDDPFAVPDPIDEEYVELVINELLAASSALSREILQRPLRSSLQENDVKAAEAMYDGPYYRTRIDQLQDTLNSEDLRALSLEPDSYGVARFDVLQLGKLTEGCIVAFGWPDASETAQTPYSSKTHGAYVLRFENVDLPGNQTGWRIWDSALLLTPDDAHIPREAWADLNFGDVLDADCEQPTS